MSVLQSEFSISLITIFYLKTNFILHPYFFAYKKFDTIAENLMSDSIESVQLAPNGVVTDIYPANGNEAGKIDLIHDKDRGKISCYARDNHTIIMQGTFKFWIRI